MRKRRNRINNEEGLQAEDIIIEETSTPVKEKVKLKDREGWKKFKDVFPEIGASILDIGGNFIPGLGSVADVIRGLDGPSDEEKEAAIAYARQLDIEEFKLEVEDKKSAREMNVETSQNEDPLVRRFPYFLASGIILGSFVFMGLGLAGVFTDSTEIVYIIIGTILSGYTNIIGFFFGSSIGSKMKDIKDTSFK